MFCQTSSWTDFNHKKSSELGLQTHLSTKHSLQNSRRCSALPTIQLRFAQDSSHLKNVQTIKLTHHSQGYSRDIYRMWIATTKNAIKQKTIKQKKIKTVEKL